MEKMITDRITDPEAYDAYMNLMQSGYNVLVVLVVLLGLAILGVLMFAYMPRTSLLQSKNETIRQLQDALSKVSEQAASDAMSDRQARTEIVADRDEREQRIVDEYTEQAASARQERDLWRHRANAADKRAKLYARLADYLRTVPTNAENVEKVNAEIRNVEDQIRGIDREITALRRAA